MLKQRKLKDQILGQGSKFKDFINTKDSETLKKLNELYQKLISDIIDLSNFPSTENPHTASSKKILQQHTLKEKEPMKPLDD